jgi:hypothetical protein
MIRILLLFGIFAVFTFVNLLSPILAKAGAESEPSKLLDPLYIASCLATVMFGLVCWSLGRNLHDIDTKLIELKCKIDQLDDRQDTACLLFRELKTEHDYICRNGAHK